jgi:Ca2+/Na+ antiporter
MLDERYQLPTGKNISSNRLVLHAGGLAIVGAGVMYLARLILGEQALGVTGGLSLALVGSIPELLAFSWLIRSKTPQMGIGALLGACLLNLFFFGIALLLYPGGTLLQDLQMPKIQVLFLGESLFLVALCFFSFLSKGSKQQSQDKELGMLTRKQR